MNAVGHVRDGDFGYRHARPQIVPHFAGHFAVKLGDGVVKIGQTDRQHRHGKLLLGVGHVLPAQGQESFFVQLQGWDGGLEIFDHQFGRETVDAGGHGRVSGEDAAGHDLLARFVKTERTVLEQHPHTLQHQKRAVPFVHVKHGGGQVQRLQRPHAANAQHDLLADAHFRIAAVKPAGDLAIDRGVLDQIGIEQIKGDAADSRFPHPAENRVVGQVHPHLTAVGVLHLLDGQVVKIQFGIRLLLPAILREILLKISVAIKQAHCHEGHTKLAGTFEMIARKHAQAAGINRQRFVDAELGREIRHQHLVLVRMRGFEPAGAGQIGAKRLLHAAKVGQIPRIRRRRRELGLVDRPQQLDGVVPNLLPELAIQPTKELGRVDVPDPPQVL